LEFQGGVKKRLGTTDEEHEFNTLQYIVRYANAGVSLLFVLHF
jgi:hypothetical protein